MAEKTYFFSAKKNAHSIEYCRNCLKNNNKENTSEYEILSNILIKCAGCKVTNLTGKEIGVAKEAIMWAENARAEKATAYEEARRRWDPSRNSRAKYSSFGRSGWRK